MSKKEMLVVQIEFGEKRSKEYYGFFDQKTAAMFRGSMGIMLKGTDATFTRMKINTLEDKEDVIDELRRLFNITEDDLLDNLNITDEGISDDS